MALEIKMNVKPFLEHLKINRHCSPETIKAYRSDLGLFAAFLHEKSLTRITQVDHGVVKDYIEHMREKANPRLGRPGLSDGSVARRLAALSSFMEFARATSHPNLRNPIKDFSRKWRKNNDPKPVDEVTLDLLLRGITDLRDRTLMTLFLASGLRVSEIQQLNRDSITITAESRPDSVEDSLCGSGEVIGKGRKRRRFFFDEETAMLVSEYIVSRTDELPPLFISERKQRMSVRAIQQRLQYWCQKLGLPHTNVHRLRHSFATRLANANINSLVLKELMGHQSFTTTQRYFKLTDTTLARGYFSAMEYLKD
jgi:site-specific recombinase XerD